MYRLILCMSIMLWLGGIGVGGAVPYSEPPSLPEDVNAQGIRAYFLALSEGESTVITGTDGFTMVVDTGTAKSATEVADFLEEHQIARIDVLVLTGEMDEHIAGTDELLKRIPVEQMIVPALIKDSILHKVHQSLPQIQTVREGQTLEWPAQLKMRILHPCEPLSLSPQANSLVFQLIHGRIKFLFTSDIHEESEVRLLEKYNVESQILKVSDGGSNQASSPPFLEKVDAHAAILFRNRPTAEGSDEVIERLNETWIDVYQTKNHGTITVISNGEDYRIEREKTKGYFDAK
ncbi:ComEC/Rec2 family competence protein [Ammoniphilus sp. YIM 78166]|uniref:ComEC/Rec2 family competence protein n=1 Tax=Ammoniphilus sp. YIM 78166 TaxID=1644106 RepID=UPI0010705140|nr:MBL fold metallo-hydrolase [Ammoniphilus sp. YIM 78166]